MLLRGTKTNEKYKLTSKFKKIKIRVSKAVIPPVYLPVFLFF